MIIQFAKGDHSANPNTTAILRAGDLADLTTYYRHDLAFREIPGLPINSHGFMARPDIAAYRPICLAAQEQVALFLSSDGAEIIQPEPSRYFEVPTVPPLPEAPTCIIP